MATTLDGPAGAGAAKPQGWGWNPLTDFTKATGALGSYINDKTKIGNLNLGVGSAIQDVANIVPGIVNLGYQGVKDVATQNWGALGQTARGVGSGLATGAVDLFTDLGTAGGLAPWTHRWENEVGNVTHGFIQPQSLLDQAQGNEYSTGQGLLGGALNDAMNLDIGAGVASKIAAAGDIGEAASLAAKDALGGKVEAVSQGVSGSGIDAAGEVAKEATIQSEAERLGVDPDLIRRRVQLFESADKSHQLVQSVINPLNPLYQLGRAANLPEGTSPVSGATLTPNAAESLTGASEGTLQEQLNPDIEAARTQARRNAAVQQEMVQMQPHVTLYRGEGMDLAEGAGVPDTNPGHWFTDNRETAQRYADQSGNGRVLEVHVPTSVAEDSFSHPMWNDRLQKDGNAYNLADHGPQYTEAARTLAEPEPVVSPVTPRQVLEQVPAALNSYLRRAAPVPEWAKTIVNHLPAPFVKLLSWSDKLRQAHESQVISRQTQVALNVVARQTENDPGIQALLKRAGDLMTERVPGVTPEVASRIIGERVRAALVLGPLWDDLDSLRAEIDPVAPGLVDHILHFSEELPPEYDTPEFRQEIQQLAEPIRQLRLQHLETLKNSTFLGAKGLDMADLQGKLMTKAEVKLYGEMQDAIKEASETEAAGRARAQGEIGQRQVEAQRARESALAPSPEGERARASAQDIEERGRDQAHADLIDLRQRAKAELTQSYEHDPAAEQLRAHDAITERQARTELEGQARIAREAQRRQIERSQGNPAYMTGEPLPNGEPHPLERLDAVNKAAQYGEEARSMEQRLAQDRVTDPAMVQRADQMDQEWQQSHRQEALTLHRQANDLESQVESNTLPSDRQADLVRQNARQADLENERTQSVNILQANKAVADLQTAIEKHLLPEDRAAAQLRETAAGKEEQLGESLSKASPGRVAPKFGPLIQAARDLAHSVEEYPELAPIVEGLPQKWGEIMDYADDHGFDPTHMPDMTRDRVRQLVNGTVRLGGEPGKIFTSSTRQARTGALAAARLEDRSIEGIVAGVVHATQEERTNMVVDWLDRVIARPMVRNERGALVVPEGGVAWDPIRRGMLSAVNPEGEHQALPGAATTWIPKQVARALDEYSRPATNPIARAFEAVTNPWRFFMLTLNPGFYLHHITGHIMLALIQEPDGFHWSDWKQAWTAFRGGFKDLPEVTGQNITMAELGKPGLVTYPDFRTALAQGGKKAALDYLTQASHRAISVSDSFARAVDYFGQKRTGVTDMEALQHANSALVDYGNLSPTEKTFLRSIIPFYGFQKGVLQIALRMPVDHPLVTQVLMQIGKLQGEQAVDDKGRPLPGAYQGVVKLGGLNLNLKSASPFKDLGTLTTAAGLVSGLQFAVTAALRSGLNAPAPFTKAGVQVDQYGKVVPKVGFLSQLIPALSSSPQASLLAGLQGNSTRTPAEAAAGFLGAPVVSNTTLENAGARNVLSAGEVANSTRKQQDQATAFPVDTNTLQNVLAQSENDQTLKIPQLPGGAPLSKAQLQQALADAEAKQQAAAALTRATGVTRSGTPVKKRARRASRHGSSGRHVSAHKVHAAHSRITKVRLTRSFARLKIQHAAGGAAHNRPAFKSSIKGVPKPR